MLDPATVKHERSGRGPRNVDKFSLDKQYTQSKLRHDSFLRQSAPRISNLADRSQAARRNRWARPHPFP